MREQLLKVPCRYPLSYFSSYAVLFKNLFLSKIFLSVIQDSCGTNKVSLNKNEDG